MTKVITGTRAEILKSFGYIILDRGQYHVAMIKADPEAFTIVCDNSLSAEREAYAFLYDEVDMDIYDLPYPDSFK